MWWKLQKLELEVEPKNVTEMLQSHGKTFMNEEFLLINEQRKQFLEMESTKVKMLWRSLKWQPAIENIAWT